MNHEIEYGEYSGQGGELEDIWAWCHICDYTGLHLMKVDMLSGIDKDDADMLLYKMVREHVAKPVQVSRL